MVASAVKICSKKKGKVRGLSELENVLLGYYIRLGPGSQESHVYLRTKRLRPGKHINRNFGIKSFYSKIGGICLHQYLGRGTRELKASKIMSIK